MKWLKILLIFPISSFACELTLKTPNQTFKVCQEDGRIYTTACKDIGSCFKKVKELKFYPNQSPLFSLCFQNNGKPRFAKLENQKNKVEVCIMGESKVVDLNSLMKFQKQK